MSSNNCEIYQFVLNVDSVWSITVAFFLLLVGVASFLAGVIVIFRSLVLCVMRAVHRYYHRNVVEPAAVLQAVGVAQV
jgi:hypothetical protein